MDTKLNQFYKAQGTYYTDPTLIFVPRFAKRIIRDIPKKKLNQIHRNTRTATERLFIFLSKFNTGHILLLKERTEFEATDIHSDTLKSIFGNRKYRIAIKILTEYNILEREIHSSYKVGAFSKSFLLTDGKIYKPFVKYIVTSESEVKTLIALNINQRRIIMGNPIARSSVIASFNCILPNEDELLKHAGKLIAKGWSNKGKRLDWERNKRKNDKMISKLIDQGVKESDLPRYTYVEQGIMTFKRLTQDGFMLPKIGNYKSGGRVYTIFTLMPKWIRESIILDNSPVVGVDYSALHPNLASGLWGDGSSVSHNMVANYLGIPLLQAKIEHLKFFNTTVKGMERMKVHKYYEDNHPKLLDGVKATKNSTYKRTSALMFKAEVELMTEVINRLVKLGLSTYIIYVYDELLTTSQYAKKVKQVMEEVATDMGYNLKAKIG